MATLYATALNELAGVFDRINDADVDHAIGMIAKAKRIVVFGAGRERLQIMGFAMRLYHMGLAAAVTGDMTTPPVGDGDLLLVSAGPGCLSTVEALLGQARKAGARTACFTAEPASQVTRSAATTLVIPAQTMARDQSAPTSFLPMGSLYEGAQFLLYEIMVMMLKDRLGESAESMRARHTNLE